VSAHEAILGLLRAAPGLVALVGDRIYPDEMDDPPVYPSITFQKVGGRRERGAVKNPGLQRASMQVSTWAESRSEVVAIAKQVQKALDRPGKTSVAGIQVDDCFYVSDLDLRDPDTGICFNHMSFNIHYREPT